VHQPPPGRTSSEHVSVEGRVVTEHDRLAGRVELGGEAGRLDTVRGRRSFAWHLGSCLPAWRPVPHAGATGGSLVGKPAPPRRSRSRFGATSSQAVSA